MHGETVKLISQYFPLGLRTAIRFHTGYPVFRQKFGSGTSQTKATNLTARTELLCLAVLHIVVTAKRRKRHH